MESFCGETEESRDDVSGRKKSRLKSLRTRLFGKNKRAVEQEQAKLSQSESDIRAGRRLGSEEDLACSQGMMGSRALSHDSIFLADQVLTEVEPVRILSQENVHSKIKALQLKLQQQNLHLGPPPLVLPIKRSEVLESGCQNDSLPHSPRKNSGTDIGASPIFTKTIYQPLPLPFLLTPKLPLTKSVSQPPSHPSVISNSTTSEPPLDFSSPAEFIPCLDTSAARHRVSIKPRNQRASTKKRVLTGESESHLPTQNNAERPESVQEEDVVAQETVLFDTDQKEEDQPVASQCLSTKFPDEPNSPSKSSSLTQQDQALLGGLPSAPPPVLRVKLQRPADNTDTRRPHSSFIPSELKNIREGMSEIPPVLCDKSNTESSSKGPSEPAPSITRNKETLARFGVLSLLYNHSQK
ncbi:hypothetical protein fugu_001389 [Takifugu bimaculatus]|uniref:DUF4592 domain-containing protein n=1 Tax=Takifugu bimaculatus TaxID=433685 RepID=A0A4Z2CJU9_9TELE|nr:hypothetical protein fugu_001389 [Takifugu bimaculatus]